MVAATPLYSVFRTYGDGISQNRPPKRSSRKLVKLSNQNWEHTVGFTSCKQANMTCQDQTLDILCGSNNRISVELTNQNRSKLTHQNSK